MNAIELSALGTDAFPYSWTFRVYNLFQRFRRNLLILTTEAVVADPPEEDNSGGGMLDMGGILSE